MKINPTDKEKLKSLVNADIENIFIKPNKLGYTYESNAGGFEMKKVKTTSSKPPLWFVEFANKQNEFNNKVVEFMTKQEVFNNKVVEFMTKQEVFNGQVVEFMREQKEVNRKQAEFNEMIINRLDRIEARLDNIVHKNNLKE